MCSDGVRLSFEHHWVVSLASAIVLQRTELSPVFMVANYHADRWSNDVPRVLCSPTQANLARFSYSTRLIPPSVECRDEVGHHARLHRPTDDASGVQIQHHSNANPIFRGPVEGEVCHPMLMWRQSAKMRNANFTRIFQSPDSSRTSR